MMEKITLAGGCFWCTEAVFSQLRGVAIVTPGFSGGDVPNPTYEEVCRGITGHAEGVQIEFDPEKILLNDILNVFFKLHDPTTLNRQGADVGTQYRSAIFYSTENQKEIAQKISKEAQELYKAPIVTEITKLKNFYPAESSHKEYYLKHRGSPYCTLVIDPKIQRLKKEFKPLIG